MKRSLDGLKWGGGLAVLLLLFGCATGGGGASRGPTDEELVQGVINDMLGALQEQDVESMVALYADDFTSDQGDKEGMKMFLQGAKEQGFLEGIQTNTEEMQITVEGDTATVEPVTVEGAFGALTLAFELRKKDGSWVVTSQTGAQ